MSPEIDWSIPAAEPKPLQHSPAPWRRASAPNDGCCHSVGVEDANGYHVADVAEEKDVPVVIAAPLMKAALARWLADYDRRETSGQPAPGSAAAFDESVEFEDIVTQARGALGAAGGNAA